MGLQGPKSNLGVQNDETFLDVTVRQIKVSIIVNL